MNEKGAKPKRLRDDPSAREGLRLRLDRYLDVPLALASLALVLVAVIELTGEVSGPWETRLATLAYFIGSVASVLVAFDASETRKSVEDKGVGELSEGEALRSILKKSEES